MEREDSRDSCACKCLRIPGFCFKPSDEILVGYYVREKVEGRRLCCNHYVAEFKIYDDNLMPWEIVKDDDHHWITSSSNDSSNKIKKTIYVFTELCKKKTRVTRRSGRGTWTGQNTRVVENVAGDKIGYKKLFTFYRDTDDKLKKKKKIIDEDHGHWIMHEFSLLGIDDYVICEISKEVEMSSQASSCPTDQAVTTKDTNLRRDVENMNMVLGDERQLGGADHDDQPLDGSGADWDENGWKAEFDKELGLDILDDKSADQCLDDYGEDWDNNGWISELYKQFDGAENHDQNELSDDTIAAVVQEIPILAGMNEPPQVQSVSNFHVEEKDVTVAVWGKNEKNNELFKGLDGDDNYDVIEISDDDSIQELPIIIDDQVEDNRAGNNIPDDLSDFLNYIAEMDGNAAVQESPFAAWEDLEQISNDFANFEQVEVELTNTTLDGSEIMLDFPFYDITNLEGAETNQQNCNISKEQPCKRMRTDADDYQKFSSRKKQRYLQI
ncbi:hypothetical protein POM88_014086 [Heracleum sosnowskyi]|uniref:NAC domain-containing protein n=1 Tax=Heracleum sosnowskyi TaxID=360622 RepID=A0AAD8IZR6_9APIA|nr:hypothetical protein POM88_014086 [Heracleum sosnowskyi]